MIRFDWKLKELENLYQLPLFELVSKAHHAHHHFHQIGEIQVCSLISIKTGGCSEDCKYCAQSARYQTPITAQPIMRYEAVVEEAKKAIARGATRVCLGAAWREIREGKQFDEILKMITTITGLGAEVCCTLGLLKEEQARRLKEAGLYAYNHNLDTSEEFYKTIITTRTYQDRLTTLDIVQQSDLSLCCGGIIGMGESLKDRLELLLNLCKRQPHPESVPINRLSQVPGTPLEEELPCSIWEIIRLIAVTRIIMPKAMIRLSCGRIDFSYQEQMICFFAGANSIFIGDKLLTVANTAVDRDEEMFQVLGLTKRPAFYAGCKS